MKRLIKQIAAVVAIAGAVSAYAVPTLYLDDGAGNTVTITDGGAAILTGVAMGSAADANGVGGAVTWIGSVGVWTVNVSTGTTAPVTTAPYPHLDLSSVNTSSAAGTMTIRWSDTGYGPSVGTFAMHIGGTTPANGSTVAFNTYADAANAVPAGGFLAGTGPLAGPAYSTSLPGGLLTGLGGAYSVTEEVIIIHTAAGGTSFNAEAQITPEGGMTLMLLGSSLACLGYLRRKLAVKA